MKQFHKFQKFMAALMVFTMLFGSVPAWAAGTDVTINTTGEVSPNTWSNTAYVGVDGKVTAIGTDVINSIKATEQTGDFVYGIKYCGSGTLSVGSLAGGIDLNSTTQAYGIYANNTGKTEVSGVGGIKARGAAYGYGIYSNGTGAGFENNVSFAIGSTINASGNNSGGRGIGAEGTGTTTVSGLGGITANGSSGAAYGIYSCGSDTGLVTNVTFANGSYINATTENAEANGIFARDKGTMTVSNLGSIEVKSSGINKNAFGIRSGNSSNDNVTMNVTFADGGKIRVTGTGNICGIFAQTTETTVSNLSSIEANGMYTVNGIYSCVSNGQVTNVSFSGAGSYINATSTNGLAYGIGAAEKGKHSFTNLGGITANGSTDTYGICSNCNINETAAPNFENNVSFVAAGGTINATSTGGNAYGIYAIKDGKTTVTNVGGIEANSSGTNKETYGIYSCGSHENFSNNVTFTGTNPTITAIGKAGNAAGIYAEGKYTTTVKDISSIEVNGSTITAGIYSNGSDTGFANNVSFTGTNPTIKATSASGEAYGIGAYMNGTTTVSNVGSITAEAKAADEKAYGIYSKGDDAGFANNVSFVASGGTIKATSTAAACGIGAFKKGTTTVTNVGGIEANGSTNTYGVRSCSSDASLQNNVTFVNGGKITAIGTSGNASGISAEMKGTTTVKNVGGITANGVVNAYGIHSNGTADTLANNVSFKGNGGQAITATATDAANAYSIFVAGQGATTVNFENSILSGKVVQDGTATLTLNFNDKSSWTPTATDVSGNVSVNMNSGSTLDTRVATGVAQNKTINLGTGTFTAAPGSKISFDATTQDIGLTTDQIKAADTSGGTIELGTVNITDSAPSAWTTPKNANLFVNSANTSQALNIAITGTTQTATSKGWLYTFTGGTSGNVSATSVKGSYTLPQVIQAKPTEAGLVDTYSFDNGDVKLYANLGPLDNSYRKSGKPEFTLKGNGNTLDGNGYGGVTVNTGDTLNVDNLKVKGFTSNTSITGAFATNGGILNLNDVIFEHAAGFEKIIDIYNLDGSTFITTGKFNGNVYNAGTNSKVALADGATLESTVQGQGQIVVTGNGVTNTADQTLDVVVKETKDLTTEAKLEGNITLEADSELTAKEEEALLGAEGKKIIVGKNAILTALANNIRSDIWNASDHSVHLTGGLLKQSIHEGGTTYIEGNTEFMNGITVENKVYVVNGIKLSAENPFTIANTLYFEGGDSQSTVSNVSTTGTLAFVLKKGANKDKAIVKAENGYNVTGAKVALYQDNEELYTKKDVIKLMAGATGSYAGETLKAKNGDSILRYKYKTYQEGDELLAQYMGKGAGDEAKSFSEGRLGGAITLTQSSDLLAGAGLSSAVAAAQTSSNGFAPYIEMQGSHGRFNTGSHVDLNSFNVVAGLAKKVGESTTVGAYIEGGNGRYTSYNEIDTGEIRADGDINYFGGGIFAHYAFKATEKGNAYIDGAFGAGHTNQDYATDSAELDSARYDAGAAYLKAHATFGYNFNIAKDAKIDAYAKYLWARQNGSDVTTNTEVPVSFDAINSSRLRAGFRYIKGIKKNVSWYGGLAYEYEFNMKAGASSEGYAIAEPDLKGASGMAELGIKFAPDAAKGWRFDAGLQGFTGKRDSLGIKLGAWYEF